MGSFTVITAREKAIGGNTSVKAAMLSLASEVTAGWIVDLQLGIISDEDKNSLIAWRQYVKSIQDIDPDTTEDITWPEQPA